jgi:hypothetical protein
LAKPQFPVVYLAFVWTETICIYLFVCLAVYVCTRLHPMHANTCC